MSKPASSLQPRSVAVAIPYRLVQATTPDQQTATRRENVSICLVSSRKHAHRLVLPKGGVEEGEDSFTAAIRELYEEAGIRPAPIQSPLSSTPHSNLVVTDHKAHKLSPAQKPGEVGFVPRAIYTAHEVLIDSSERGAQLDDWPESQERSRHWLPLDQALERIAWRKDIATLLELWASGIPS